MLDFSRNLYGHKHMHAPFAVRRHAGNGTSGDASFTPLARLKIPHSERRRGGLQVTIVAHPHLESMFIRAVWAGIASKARGEDGRPTWIVPARGWGGWTTSGRGGAAWSKLRRSRLPALRGCGRQGKVQYSIVLYLVSPTLNPKNLLVIYRLTLVELAN